MPASVRSRALTVAPFPTVADVVALAIWTATDAPMPVFALPVVAGLASTVPSRSDLAANWMSVPTALTVAAVSTPAFVRTEATPIERAPANPTDAASPTPDTDDVASAAVGPLSGLVASTTTPAGAVSVAAPTCAVVVTSARLTAIATPTPDPPDPTVLPSAVDEPWPFEPAWIF